MLVLVIKTMNQDNLCNFLFRLPLLTIQLVEFTNKNITDKTLTMKGELKQGWSDCTDHISIPVVWIFEPSSNSGALYLAFGNSC